MLHDSAGGTREQDHRFLVLRSAATFDEQSSASRLGSPLVVGGQVLRSATTLDERGTDGKPN